VPEGEAFAELRVELASRLAAKAGSHPQLSVEEYRSAATTIAAMKQTLRGMIDEVPPQTYSVASRLLADLQTQLRLQTLSTGEHVRD